MVKILWLEDSLDISSSLLRDVQKELNTEIDTAKSFFEALKKICSYKYDLVILDVVIPVSDKEVTVEENDILKRNNLEYWPMSGGILIYRIIRRHYRISNIKVKKNVPIMFFSVLDREELELCGNDKNLYFLKKLVMPNEFTSKLKTIIEKAKR